MIWGDHIFKYRLIYSCGGDKISKFEMAVFSSTIILSHRNVVSSEKAPEPPPRNSILKPETVYDNRRQQKAQDNVYKYDDDDD